MLSFSAFLPKLEAVYFLCLPISGRPPPQMWQSIAFGFEVSGEHWADVVHCQEKMWEPWSQMQAGDWGSWLSMNFLWVPKLHSPRSGPGCSPARLPGVDSGICLRDANLASLTLLMWPPRIPSQLWRNSMKIGPPSRTSKYSIPCLRLASWIYHRELFPRQWD